MASLANIAPFKNGAVLTSSGGVAEILVHLGNTLTERSVTAFHATTAALNKAIEFSVKHAKASASAPGGYTQNRRNIFIRQPILLANGNYTTNTCSFTLSTDPESGQQDLIDLITLMAQVLNDVEGANFLYNMSVE